MVPLVFAEAGTELRDRVFRGSGLREGTLYSVFAFVGNDGIASMSTAAIWKCAKSMGAIGRRLDSSKEYLVMLYMNEFSVMSYEEFCIWHDEKVRELTARRSLIMRAFLWLGRNIFS